MGWYLCLLGLCAIGFSVYLHIAIKKQNALELERIKRERLERERLERAASDLMTFDSHEFFHSHQGIYFKGIGNTLEIRNQGKGHEFKRFMVHFKGKHLVVDEELESGWVNLEDETRINYALGVVSEIHRLQYNWLKTLRDREATKSNTTFI